MQKRQEHQEQGDYDQNRAKKGVLLHVVSRANQVFILHTQRAEAHPPADEQERNHIQTPRTASAVQHFECCTITRKDGPDVFRLAAGQIDAVHQIGGGRSCCGIDPDRAETAPIAAKSDCLAACGTSKNPYSPLIRKDAE